MIIFNQYHDWFGSFHFVVFIFGINLMKAFLNIEKKKRLAVELVIEHRKLWFVNNNLKHNLIVMNIIL